MDEDAKKRGPGQPRKVTEEAITLAERMLAIRCKPWEVKSALRGKWPMSHETCRKILCRARENMLAKTKRPREEHQADAISFLEGVLRDTSAETRDKLFAQDQLIKLLGLATPPIQKHEVSGPDGGPVATAQGSVVILLPDNGRDPVNTNGHNAATSAS